MQALSFYLFYPFIWLVSKLPLRVLYFISDYIVYPIIYKVVGYRKKVVRDNMDRVFHNKPLLERRELESKFYHFLSDLFMETVKSFNMPIETLQNRVSFKKDDQVEHLLKNAKGVVLTLGHVGNYEWLAQYIPIFYKVKLAVPYKKITNPYFDEMFRKSREKGGAVLFHTDKTYKFLAKEKEGYVIGLANDQSASANKSYWTRFLGQDTNFFVGTEKIARQMGFAVVFLYIRVRGRGNYEAEIKIITEDPSKDAVGSIMEKHAALLQENILEAPEYWLWSHKRWKNKKPEGFGYGFPPTEKARN